MKPVSVKILSGLKKENIGSWQNVLANCPRQLKVHVSRFHLGLTD